MNAPPGKTRGLEGRFWVADGVGRIFGDCGGQREGGSNEGKT